MTTPQGPTAKARKCSGCGESLNPGDSFCANCGASVTACPSCGYGLQPGDRFCPQCGYRVPGGTVAGPSRPISAWDRVLQRLRSATIGEFEIQRELGRGGMAAVYLGHELALNRKVAIKVMSPSLLMGQGMVDRFRQEAITVANLNHQNIVTIHAVRQFEDLHYFVMQFVAGCSLETIVRHHQALPVPVIRAVLFQVGSALAHAHAQGVIHRDIKPGNILCNKEGMAIVTDFGIAKVMESPSQTQTGVLVGTPAYMSPEQCKTGHVTWASDQYSLGVVAYEMVTGRSPFTGPTMTVMHAHVHDPVPSLLESRPDVPPDLDEAVGRMLAKEPEERWPSMGAALRGLGAMPLLPGDPVLQEMAELVQQHQAHPSLPTTPVSPILRSRGPTAKDAEAPATVSILQPPDALELGDQVQLNAAVLNATGVIIKDAVVTWSSSDAGVAAIDPTSGVLSAAAEGVATITASAGGVETTVEIAVTPRQASEVVVTAPKAWLGVGETLILRAAIRDRMGHELDGIPVWSTSDPAVAAVSDRGVVTGHGPGPVAITAEVGWVKDSISLTVGEAEVAAVQLSVPPRSVSVGETFRLTATPLDGRDMPLGRRRGATWASGDPAVATVSAEGVVSALAPGSVSITATIDGKSASVTVSIQAAAVSTVRVSEPPQTIAIGEPFTLRATAAGQRGQVMELPVTWTSDDPGVATVSSSGTVTPKASGRAVITATAAGVSANAVVTIPAAAARPVAKRAEGRRPIGLAWLWVAIPVLLLAVAAVLWFRRGGTNETATVTVASVAVTPQGGTLSLGDSVPLVAVVKDGSDSVLADRTPVWTSSDPAVADVDASGIVRARGVGQATIAATVDGQQATAAFTVSATAEPVAAVRLANHPTRVEEGGRLRLEAVVTSATGSALAGRAVEWSSDNASVASVNPTTGEVTGHSAGRATIRASVEGTSAATVITVAPPAPARLVVAPPNLVLTTGERRAVLASVRDASGRTLENAPIKYESGDRGVVRVDNQGRISAVGPGATNVTVASGNLTTTIAIVVNGATRTPVAAVRIAQGDTTLLPGQKLTLRAATADANGAGLGRPVQWSSSNEAVAAVDGQGAVTARAEGNAYLVAVSEGVRDSIRLAVAAPAVVPDTGRGGGPPVAAAEEQFKAQVAGYITSLSGGDKETVQRLFAPRTGDEEKRMRKLVEVMDRRDFSVSQGEPTVTSSISGDQARVEFTREIGWRGNFGGSSKKEVRFIAIFERSGSRWTVTAVRTAPDTDL